MPLTKYCLLKAYPIDLNTDSDDNHIYIHALADELDYSVAINVRSASSLSEMFYALKEYPLRKLYSLLPYIENLQDGRYPKSEHPAYYLDYYEMPLFSDADLRSADTNKPGLFGFGARQEELVTTIPFDEKEPLCDRISALAEQTFKDVSAYILVFGQMWGPKADETDWTFGFTPALGIHDIHMNQNSFPAKFREKDAPHQDGAVFFVFPERNLAYGCYSLFRKAEPDE